MDEDDVTGAAVESAAPLALYRRYRPDTFAEVIGQDHVTEPLRRALNNNRVNHAYLFSGPRGCGKTTSARILARSLNCEQGPTPDPCGRCDSCRDLARGGPGSIDVIEIDAASHGGVDDARDLREKAFYAPVSSRYKVYIVDEAHMVTSGGFNALLKLVEEPPPHVKFIFATTEPERVIGTIRSRTHHYPFRLVPPKVLTSYLAEICDAENVVVDPAVLPLVVRAGGGSVRDSLSVLDQLLGAAGSDGVEYAEAAALLGHTPEALLDAVVDGFAAGDAKQVFSTIDKVMEVGQDPRRFADDLLHRLRDLVIVAAVPDAISNELIGEVSPEQGERLANQAAVMGAGELTRAAEVIAEGLTNMRGTTAPRLHLELMCSRVLLPGADTDDRGTHARLDRLERRIGMAGGEAAPTAAPAVAPAAAPVSPTPAAPTAAEPSWPEPTQQPERSESQRQGEPQPEARQPEPQRQAEPQRQQTPAPDGAAHPTTQAGGISAGQLREQWPQVLELVRQRKRFAWVLLQQHLHVMDVNDGALMLGASSPGARESFSKGGSIEALRSAILDLLGADLRVEVVVDESGGGASRPKAEPRQSNPDPWGGGQAAAAPAAPQRQQATPAQAAPTQDAPEPAVPPQDAPRQDGPPPGDGPPPFDGPPPEEYPPEEDAPPTDRYQSAPAAAPTSPTPAAPTPASAPPPADPGGPTPPRPSAARAAMERARAEIRPVRSGSSPAEREPEDEDLPDRSDPTLQESEDSAELLRQSLGAELIGEE